VVFDSSGVAGAAAVPAAGKELATPCPNTDRLAAVTIADTAATNLRDMAISS
jgi:hypothetical protein